MNVLVETLEKIANWPKDDAPEIIATEAPRMAREALEAWRKMSKDAPAAHQ